MGWAHPVVIGVISALEPRHRLLPAARSVRHLMRVELGLQAVLLELDHTAHRYLKGWGGGMGGGLGGEGLGKGWSRRGLGKLVVVWEGRFDWIRV